MNTDGDRKDGWEVASATRLAVPVLIVVVPRSVVPRRIVADARRRKKGYGTSLLPPSIQYSLYRIERWRKRKLIIICALMKKRLLLLC